MEQEKARLPETQGEAAKYMEGKTVMARIGPEIERIQTAIATLPTQERYKTLHHEFHNKYFSMNVSQRATMRQLLEKAKEDIDKESESLQKELAKLKRSNKYAIHRGHVQRFGQSRNVRGAPTNWEERHWTHVGKCPVRDCEGFVNLEHVCGLCKVEVCKDCMEPSSSEHVCDTNNVENVKALKKEAKPCPK